MSRTPSCANSAWLDSTPDRGMRSSARRALSANSFRVGITFYRFYVRRSSFIGLLRPAELWPAHRLRKCYVIPFMKEKGCRWAVNYSYPDRYSPINCTSYVLTSLDVFNVDRPTNKHIILDRKSLASGRLNIIKARSHTLMEICTPDNRISKILEV